MNLVTTTPMMMTVVRDESLESNRRTFQRIVEENQRLVRAIVFSHAGRVDAVQDISQEVFLIAWQQIWSVPEASRKSWLCTVARNLSHNWRRKHSREVFEINEDESLDENGATFTPYDAMSRRERERAVCEALNNIKPAYREPLVLYYWCGKSMEETARELGLNESTTKKRLSRGREQLKLAVETLMESTVASLTPDRIFTIGVLGAVGVTAPTVEAMALGKAAMLKGGVVKSAVVKAMSLAQFKWPLGVSASLGVSVLIALGVARFGVRDVHHPLVDNRTKKEHEIARTSEKSSRTVRRITRQAHELLVRKIVAARNHQARLSASANYSGGVGVAGAVDEPRGTLDKEYVRTQVKAIIPLLQDCYKLALVSSPSLSGRMDVEFLIIGDHEIGGVVETSEINDTSTLRNEQLEECVRETMFTLEFAPPEHGGRVVVRYPFQFAPQ